MIDSFIYRKNPYFPNRYISPEKLFSYLQTIHSDSIAEVGNSALGKPIFKMSLGNGPVKVVAWSQMHGNESNATHAMLDLLEFFKHSQEVKKKLLAKITLDFIFMLNPDGSEKWTRRNALEIDINRDFLKESSKEMRLLKSLVKEGNYTYALNLHEQRTIFTTDGKNPATLSFLAPSQDLERSVTETRKKAMAVIADIYKKLGPNLSKNIARYSDEFYPTSVGDNFTIMGIPCILFEGGHFPDDYNRENTRKYYTIALYEALVSMAELQGSTDNWEIYREIPENRESHYDVIYRNVKLNTDFECILDIAVQFREELLPDQDEIVFTPIVVEVGDIGRKKGWKEIDCTGKKFISTKKFPKLDAKVDFRIE